MIKVIKASWKTPLFNHYLFIVFQVQEYIFFSVFSHLGATKIKLTMGEYIIVQL